MSPKSMLFACLAALLLSLPASAADTQKAPAPSAEEVLRLIDKRLSFASDYKGVVRMREIRKDGVEMAIELQVYRRDSHQDLIFLITQPKHMAGGGFLRIGKNLWEYNPVIGQWERTTRRGNIVGTIACEADFDRSRLAEDYDATDEAPETVNGTVFRKLLLKAKPGSEVAFPVMRLWVDADHNIVKRVGHAPSGKVLRTDLIRGYQRVKDPVSGNLVYHYKEVLEMESEEGTRLVVRYEDVELAPLSANIFTKAWIEGRTR
ncbi:outer membrane lipoprotein-sorting protein [Pyxidicoccus sp. MSG2]|uniref:outer membrane lipoprotein-sorting protein n=1 Tax=Pyxidicoccus sp. MSG2 TaxID=2996790 RepID=UPI00226EC683|nr:outer membrane lipoprotein-sorting protein [Pyxidicoccus sp. MSG2]MCY1016173.1 outer membrane lipoprotein-sorting protein [Pyxidicoccus sp. MSG2]